MGDDITIGVTEIVNNIEVTAQPNDQIVDINVTDNSENVTLNITPTVIEINVNKGSSYARWGSILGTLTDQTDLANALILKADLIDGLVPSYQLPSYVDDVIEVANYAALPASGETGKIYITLDTNHIYRWSGSTYIEITDNTAVWGAITGTLSSQTDLSTALNEKALKTTTISTNAPLSGGGDLSANRTLSISQASASVDGYLSATDWATFNNKQPALGYTPANDSAVVHIEGVETVNGIKTFSNSTKFDYGINLKQDTTTAYFPNYTTIDGYNNGYIVNNGDARAAIFYLANNVSRVYNFPDANGTFALTSDLSAYALDNSVVKLTGDQTVAGIKTFSSDVKSTAFRLTGGTTGTGLYYGHTNKVVLANYTVGGGIDFETNGGNINMILNSSGNLGIGVDPSAWDTVWKVLQISKGSYYASDYSNIMAHNLYVAGEDTKYISTNLASQYEQNSGAHWWYTAPSGTAGANVTLTPRMILDNGGNVGIGTTSPQERFEVAGLTGNIRIYGRSGIAQNQITSNVYYNGSSWVRDTSAGAVAVNLNASDGVITFNTTSATSGFPDERMRITSGGNVRIGTSTVDPSENLTISKTLPNITSQNGGVLGLSNGYYSCKITSYQENFLDLLGLGFETTFAGASSTRFRIYANGNYQFFGSNISDERAKENINNLDFNATEKLMALQPKSYYMKNDNEKLKYGFIAQDVFKVLPDLINGNLEDDGFVGLDYNGIIPLLTKSIQELYEQVKDLKAEIELLKAK